MQSVTDTLATTSECVLAGQLVHSSLPALGLYEPAPQGEQVPPSAPVYPALHLQSVITVLPGGECELAGQTLTHDSDPKMLLYVPAEQGSQGPRSGPVYPSLHTHVLLPAPDFEDDTAEHRVHASLDDAPGTAE